MKNYKIRKYLNKKTNHNLNYLPSKILKGKTSTFGQCNAMSHYLLDSQIFSNAKKIYDFLLFLSFIYLQIKQLRELFQASTQKSY